MRLLLADDHPLFREGLQYLLETYNIKVVGVAQDGLEAYEMARSLHPDVILMDIKMPGYSGIDALKLIKAEMPEINIIMLTTYDDDQDLFAAFKYGASGYLMKNTNARDLVDMLNELEKGELLLSPGLASRLLLEFGMNNRVDDAITFPSEETAHRVLNERQLIILDFVSQGHTYKETAEALGLTERTVKYHMGKIIEALHLENRNQVIAYAAQTRLVEFKKN